MFAQHAGTNVSRRKHLKVPCQTKVQFTASPASLLSKRPAGKFRKHSIFYPDGRRAQMHCGLFVCRALPWFPGPHLNTGMPDTQIDFSAPAEVRKWPSLDKQRVSASLGARPYMISEGTLDECIQQFMQLREGQRHLYEIHTAPQSDLVTAISSTEHIVELARLRDFLGE